MTIPKRVTTIMTNGPSGVSFSSKPLTSVPRQRIVTGDVSDPEQLARMLQNMQSAVDTATQNVETNPHAAPCIVRRVVLTNGGVTIVTHVLGRAFTGWCICRVWPTGSGAFLYPTELQAGDAGYPPGKTAAMALILKGRSADVVDVCISGD